VTLVIDAIGAIDQTAPGQTSADAGEAVHGGSGIGTTDHRERSNDTAMKRHLRLAGLVAGVAIVAAACSSGGASTAPSAAASAVPSAATSAAPSGPAELTYKGEISYWNTMRDFEAVEVQKQLDAWQTLHPGITVKMDLKPFDGADKAYETAANNAVAPDLFRSDVGWVSGFANQEMLLDLTSYFPNASSTFLEAPVQTATYQGKLWGVPQVTDALGLMCNKTVLTAAGLSAAPGSWDELVSAGAKVTDLTAQKYGFYMRGDSYWSQPFIWGWGGYLFEANDQGKVTSIGVNSTESVSGWNYLKDKVLGTVAPATWDFKTDYDNMNAGFKAGTTMCIMQGPWQTADILKGAAFSDPTNLVIAPIPTGVDGKTGSPVGGHNWVVGVDVGKDQAKTDAVVSLLQYLTAPEQQAELAVSLSLLPTNLAAYDVQAVKDDAVITAWKGVLAKATNRSGVPGAQGIYDSFTKNYQLFLTGANTAQDALDATANTWQTTVFKDQMAQ
jgi:arabinogalactan oligomer / maltooligosaccharide transport system substrate-binding protein